jgi:hypothetical protein
MKTKRLRLRSFGLHFVISQDFVDENLEIYAEYFQKQPYLCPQVLARHHKNKVFILKGKKL